MARHRTTYTPRRSTRRSRQVREQTIGSHVARGATGRRVSHGPSYAEGIARKANARRIIVIVIVAVAIIGIAVAAGMMAFRGVLGSQMSLKNSDAAEALVAAKEGEPSFVLVNVELGEAAAPLDNNGPDVFMLVRLDPQKESLALIYVPATLQITVGNQSDALSDLAAKGDAAIIGALVTFAKIDIAHYVKMSEADVVGFIDALGGIEIDVPEVIDDPRAGSIYLEQGRQTLDGQAALVFLRATNIKLGEESRVVNRLNFASHMVEKLFSSSGSFASRLETVAPFFQTDLAVSDFEAIDGWLGGVSANDIACTSMPGYTTEVTDVTGQGGGRFIGSASSWQELLGKLEEGQDVGSVGAVDTSGIDAGSFTVEVQNGTSIEGAAGITADALKAQGFNVVAVGNAEQPVYDETLVVYKETAEEAARAQAVVDALGVGRRVEGSYYYSFDTDILVIIGADLKPVS